MLAYDYLKENPQARHKQVCHGWASLFTDDDVPHAVKEELIELNSYTSDITDALLYWHQQYVIITVACDTAMPSIDWAKLAQSTWLERVYSARSLKNTSVGNSLRLLSCITADDFYFKYPLTFKETQELCCSFSSMRPLENVIIHAIHKSRDANTQFSYTQGISGRVSLLKTLSKRLIATATEEQLLLLSNMLNDVDIKEGQVFDSIKAVHRAHDERTERETMKLIEACGDSAYVYTKEFMSLVNDYGFFLPSGPESLVRRGKQHRNCVGTYNDTHMSSYTKIIFSKTSTIELRFEDSFGMIVSTRVSQNRGHCNKPFQETLELVNLRLSLTGQPWSILKISLKERSK